jgi:poly-beta-1,6-N-acetyl-D-glucosamine synthase
MISTSWSSSIIWLSLLPLALLLIGYALWMIVGFRRVHKSQNVASNGLLSPQPFISVIVAAHNEADHLPATLNALAEVDFPPERVEYILVNDRSSDDTLLQMQAEASRHSNWQAISSTPSPDFEGKVNALRCGTDTARGDYFIFLDADCSPSRDWLNSFGTHVSHFDVICGHISSPSDQPGIWYRLLNLEHLFSSLQVMAGSGNGTPLFSRGGNWGYSRKIWAKCGGWTGLRGKSWGDDILMMDQFRQQPGTSFGYAPGASVLTPPPPSCRGWLSASRRRYGKVKQLAPASLALHSSFYLLLLVLLLVPLLLPQMALPWLAYCSLILLTFYSVIHRGARLLNQRYKPAMLLLFLLLLPPWVLLQSLAGTLLNSSSAVKQLTQEDSN